MISKTIGFRGLAYFQTNPYENDHFLSESGKTASIPLKCSPKFKMSMEFVGTPNDGTPISISFPHGIVVSNMVS